MLQLGKKTGILTIEHGEQATFEEALLRFVDGQIIEAKVGLRSGRNALNWLSTWGMCRFIFMAMPPLALPAQQSNPRLTQTPSYVPPQARVTQKLPALQTSTDP